MNYINKISKLFKLVKNKIWFKGLINNIAANIELENLIENLEFDTVFDIGSNKGQFILLLEKKFPNKLIHSFDPLKENIEKQKKFFKNYKNIFFYTFGIGIQNEKKEFFITKRRDSSSFLKVTENINNDYNIVEKRIVLIKSLDEIIKMTNFPKNILVKIDVQGFELNVLHSGKDVLNKIKYIIIEVSDKILYENQALSNDIIQFLKKKNFSIHRESLPNKIYKTDIIQKDILFVNNSSID